MANKTIPFLALICILGTGVLVCAQPRYGIKAGLNLTTIHYAGSENPYFANAIYQTPSDPGYSGFIAGVAELDWKKNLTLSAELQVTGKGYHLAAIDSTQDFSTYTAHLWYAQIPVMINARWSGFFAGVGPYLGFGLAGTQKWIKNSGLTGGPIEQSNKTTFGSGSDNYFRAFDFGAQAQAGYSFRNVRLIISYSLGLANAIPKFYASGASARHRVLSVSAAYFLGVGE